MWRLSNPLDSLCAEAQQLRETEPPETIDRSTESDSPLVLMTPNIPLSPISLYRDELYNPEGDIIQLSDTLIEQIIYQYKREVDIGRSRKDVFLLVGQMRILFCIAELYHQTPKWK